MANPVIHFEIVGKDAPKLREFYKEAFDWEMTPTPGAGEIDYTLIQNEKGITGGIGSAPEGYDGHVTFYVAVDDIEQALQKVESLGAKRMMGPDKVPGGPVIGLFRDPQQHVIGLVQP